MRTVMNSSRLRKGNPEGPLDLESAIAARVIGQPAAVSAITPYIHMYLASLAPEGRPVGVFLLLGPSGTGKTKTVEALADVIHGSEKHLLKIDCGEFQMEHEVAKLIGAPPGYLGHRETQPMFNQAKLNAVTSERCSLSLVLFDEIEKAAPSLTRLLLGVLDKATLRLGDNTSVNFERSLIFMTSNLGAREMIRILQPDFGFQAAVTQHDESALDSRLRKVGMHAVRRKFAPEFVNRIDAVVTYQPLAEETLAAILDQHLSDFQNLVIQRLGLRAFVVLVTPAARSFLLKEGTSPQYGARELKRTLHRRLVQPIAMLIATGQIDPGAAVTADFPEGADELGFSIDQEPPRRSTTRRNDPYRLAG